MIKIALSFFFAALSLFLAAEAFSLLSLTSLTKAFYQTGALAVLVSFGLMFAALSLYAGSQIVSGIRRYCSGIARRQRRLWFVQGKLDQERRLFLHRRLQTRYFLEARRRRLAHANNRKHCRSLAESIENDLKTVKPRVSTDQLKAWRRQNHDFRRKANIEGLIALQQTILAHF